MPNEFFNKKEPPPASHGSLFPLFEAPFEDAADYAGAAICSLCGKSDPHCFDLGIGSDLMISCPKCRAENGLEADDRKDTPCRMCKTLIPFPKLAGPIRTCPSCLRAGRAAITKDSELGMISWEQAIAGETHGRPGLKRRDFELVTRERGWIAAKVAQPMMFELLRTPGYLTIQGEQWQFCCQRPMIFLGAWSREDFNHRAPGEKGRELFDKIVQDSTDDLWNDEMGDETGIYVFRCPTCSRMTAHWDLA